MPQYHVVEGFLDRSEVNDLVRQIRTTQMADGAATASGIAKQIKNNRQITDAENKRLITRIEAMITRNAEFRAMTMSRYLVAINVNKYGEGMFYGAHSDAPYMNGLRVDISFTLFLSDPATYDGGELVVETELGEQSFKLPAGAMLIYPSGGLHRVNQVTRGARLAVIGWVQSQIRDPAKRQIVQELQQVRDDCIREQGNNRNTDILGKIGFNLTRMWSD